MVNPKLFNEMVRNNDSTVKQSSIAWMLDSTVVRMWEAIETYMEQGQPLIIIVGADYGQGSSRDLVAKIRITGMGVFVAAGFERTHRTNLVRIGILPLQFINGKNRKTLHIDGTEIYTV